MLAVSYARVQNTMNRTSDKPLATFGFGAAVLVGVPVVILVSFITILLIPLGLIALGCYLIIIYLGTIISGSFLGREFLRLVRGPADSLYLAMVIGVTLLLLLTLIPYAGGFVWLLAIIVGMGMIAFGMVETLKAARAAKAQVEQPPSQ